MFSVLVRGALSALALVLAAGWAAPALACKCRPQTVEEAKGEATALFEGRVVEIADEAPTDGGPPPGKRVTLALVRVWKGLENEERVTLRTNESSASCGYAFAADSSYLVYAAGSLQDLQVSSCSRTRPMAEAAEDLGALGAGITPVKVAPQPLADAGSEDKPPAARRGGCAGTHAHASAGAWWLALPAVGFVRRRRKR